MNDEFAALWPDREAILYRMEPTIRYFARKYTFRGQEYSDLICQGRLIVWTALVEPARTDRLYTYLRLRLSELQNYILENQIIRSRNRQEEVSRDLNIPSAAAAGGVGDVLEICVSETERICVKMILGGYTRAEIRARLGIRNATLVELINELGRRIQQNATDAARARDRSDRGAGPPERSYPTG